MQKRHFLRLPCNRARRIVELLNFAGMSEDADERGYEVEALQSIFEDEFSWIEEPMEFEVSLKPVVEEGVEVHVEASLRVKYVENYPSESIPEYDVRTVKGLSSPLLEEMKELAIKCSTEELGGPVVYNACEALKEWLTEHLMDHGLGISLSAKAAGSSLISQR